MMNLVDVVNLKITLKFVSNKKVLKQEENLKGINEILISNNDDFVPSLFDRIGYNGTLDEKVNFRTQERLNDGFHYVLAFDGENKVVGFTEFKISITKNEKIIKAINIGTSAVSKEFHGNGIAKMLYGFVDELAVKLKADVVFRSTWSLNVKQLKLYERFGYKEVKREPGLRGNGNDLVTFCKVLKG